MNIGLGDRGDQNIYLYRILGDLEFLGESPKNPQEPSFAFVLKGDISASFQDDNNIQKMGLLSKGAGRAADPAFSPGRAELLVIHQSGEP